jgi:hypothetical protein
MLSPTLTTGSKRRAEIEYTTLACVEDGFLMKKATWALRGTMTDQSGDIYGHAVAVDGVTFAVATEIIFAAG